MANKDPRNANQVLKPKIMVIMIILPQQALISCQFTVYASIPKHTWHFSSVGSMLIIIKTIFIEPRTWRWTSEMRNKCILRFCLNNRELAFAALSGSSFHKIGLPWEAHLIAKPGIFGWRWNEDHDTWSRVNNDHHSLQIWRKAMRYSQVRGVHSMLS